MPRAGDRRVFISIETAPDKWGIAHTPGIFIVNAASRGCSRQRAGHIYGDRADRTMLTWMRLSCLAACFASGYLLTPDSVLPVGNQFLQRTLPDALLEGELR